MVMLIILQTTLNQAVIASPCCHWGDSEGWVTTPRTPCDSQLRPGGLGRWEIPSHVLQRFVNISTATRTAAEITEVQFLVKNEPLRKVFALRSLGSTKRMGLAKRALTGHWDLSRVSGFCVITAWLCSTALPAASWLRPRTKVRHICTYLRVLRCSAPCSKSPVSEQSSYFAGGIWS